MAIEIETIERAVVYFVNTTDPNLNDLRRYASDHWVISFRGRDLRIEEPEEIETEFQRVLLLNTENQIN